MKVLVSDFDLTLYDDNYANNIIDLVALGMIADVMDLRNFETKRIIDMGLAHITNPFFQTMVLKQEYSLKGEITSIGIAFYVVPFGSERKCSRPLKRVPLSCCLALPASPLLLLVLGRKGSCFW